MSDSKEISRRRLAAFFEARLRARLVEQNKAKAPSAGIDRGLVSSN